MKSTAEDLLRYVSQYDEYNAIEVKVPRGLLIEAVAEIQAGKAQRDMAYQERNIMVALFGRLAMRAGYPVGIKKIPIEDWDPEWYNCVFIELECGQLSWHIHDSELYLFEGLPEYKGEYDGHTTDEKYERAREWLGVKE